MSSSWENMKNHTFRLEELRKKDKEKKMRIKIWMKSKDNKICVLTQEDGVDSPKDVAKKVVSDELISSLALGRDYGYVKIDDKKSEFCEELAVTRTDLANIVASLLETVVTLSFNKKDGSERILTGYTHGDKDAFGRFYFVEIGSDDDQVRLVDPRELNWVHFMNASFEYVVAHIKDVKPTWL